MESQEDKIKWSAFLAGDKKAYSWLYTTYVGDLFRYGTRFTADAELVKDSIQEVFIYMYRHRRQLSVPGNVKVYLFVSLKNNLFRAMQKAAVYEAIAFDEMPFMLEPTVEERFIEEEFRLRREEQVAEILSILTPRQQEIIYYRFVQEMGFDEICELMNFNYQSAQNLIQRSLKKLKEACLENCRLNAYIKKQR